MYEVMPRVLKRVPLDFDWPIGKPWDGYSPKLERIKDIPELMERFPFLQEAPTYKTFCNLCEEHFGQCVTTAEYCIWDNPELRKYWFQEPPKGDGYQCWEMTGEGSPISPVFDNLESLCQWLSKNAMVYGKKKATVGEWILMMHTGVVDVES